MNSTRESDLRAAQLRVTPGRIAILGALDTAPHSTADALHRIILNELPSISVQSVHNVLGDLDAAGLIRRIEPAGSAALYELRIGDNHHHVVCTNCAAVSDVDCVHGEAPCLEPSNTSGYTVAAAEITFWGLCPDCQTSSIPVHLKEKK